MNLNESFLKIKLKERKDNHTYRNLKTLPKNFTDFSSNDYLGFAKSPSLQQKIHSKLNTLNHSNGSTGSRLLCGNSTFAVQLEKQIANFHEAEAALLFNSGYDANLGLLSCIAQKNDTIISDSLIHASLIDGIRLSYAKRYKFEHNNIVQLEQKLQLATGNIFVVVESIYSMDGDTAPLIEICKICDKYNAHLIVDEAHGIGVFGQNGKGKCEELKIHKTTFSRIVTYGKAMGCHGACILGSENLKNYLINFCRSFIYTTAAPLHNLVAIQAAYEQLQNDNTLQTQLANKISYFKKNSSFLKPNQYIESDSAIQSIVIGDSVKCKRTAEILQKNKLDIRPILSPTVAEKTERLRICLHTFNTYEEIDNLTQLLKKHI